MGSKTGRKPPGGYPEIDEELGGFLAGFIEGEACFSIVCQSRGFGYRCAMRLCARADDAELIDDLARATRIGSVGPVEARGTSRPQVGWSIVAKADCLRLVEILDRYPLRGRKSRDFAIWRAAVKWWVGEDATVRRPSREWQPLEYLKERLHQARRYRGTAEMSLDDSSTELQGDWGDFLAGFATAEGSFTIAPSGPQRFAPRFQLNLRADDLPLLKALQERTGLGGLNVCAKNGDRSSPAAKWSVTGSANVVRLAGILEMHPPRGRKAREFKIWREGVLEYTRVGRGAPPLSVAERARVHARVGRLGADLKGAREYREGFHSSG